MGIGGGTVPLMEEKPLVGLRRGGDAPQVASHDVDQEVARVDCRRGGDDLVALKPEVTTYAPASPLQPLDELLCRLRHIALHLALHRLAISIQPMVCRYYQKFQLKLRRFIVAYLGSKKRKQRRMKCRSMGTRGS